MGVELMTDRYSPITSQTRYPLRQAASPICLLFYYYYYAIISLFISVEHGGVSLCELTQGSSSIYGKYMYLISPDLLFEEFSAQ